MSHTAVCAALAASALLIATCCSAKDEYPPLDRLHTTIKDHSIGCYSPPKSGKRKKPTQKAEVFEKVHPKSDIKRKIDLPDFGPQNAKKRFFLIYLNHMLKFIGVHAWRA